MRPMRHRAAGAQRRRKQRRLGQLLLGRAGLLGPLRVNLDAIRALRCQRYRNGDQLLVFERDHPALDHRLVERHKRLEGFGSQFAMSYMAISLMKRKKAGRGLPRPRPETFTQPPAATSWRSRW